MRRYYDNKQEIKEERKAKSMGIIEELENKQGREFHSSVRKRFEGLQQTVHLIDDAVNMMGCDQNCLEIFYDEFSHTHRTLQQKIVGLFLSTICKFASEGGTDGRNESSHKVSKEIWQMLKQKGMLTDGDCVRFPLI